MQSAARSPREPFPVGWYSISQRVPIALRISPLALRNVNLAVPTSIRPQTLIAFHAILSASLKLEALERFMIECAILKSLDLSIILFRLRGRKLICLFFWGREGSEILGIYPLSNLSECLAGLGNFQRSGATYWQANLTPMPKRNIHKPVSDCLLEIFSFLIEHGQREKVAFLVERGAYFTAFRVLNVSHILLSLRVLCFILYMQIYT